MEALVVTLETAKKLKAAGLEIDSPVFGWQMLEGEWVIHSWDEIDEDMEWYIAFTAQEIADQLLKIGRFELKSSNYESRIDAWFWPTDLSGRIFYAHGPTMSEALAEIWLKLNPAPTKVNERK